ncbi:lipase esterase family protein [Ilyonectria robusta]
MSQTQDDGGEHSRFAHLSQAHPEWNKVASKQRELEPLAQRLYSLPLEEFRKVPYRPPPLPANAPVPGIDIIIREDEVIVRDGAKVKCAVVAQISSHEGITGIIGQILNIPVTCHPDHFPKSKYEYSSYVQNANSPIVSASMMRIFWKNYLPRAHPDPRTSPLLAPSFKGLPPAYYGQDDADFGLSHSVNITLKIYPGMPHAFYVYPDLEPSVEYFEAMVDWINQF